MIPAAAAYLGPRDVLAADFPQGTIVKRDGPSCELRDGDTIVFAMHPKDEPSSLSAAEQQRRRYLPLPACEFVYRVLPPAPDGGGSM